MNRHLAQQIADLNRQTEQIIERVKALSRPTHNIPRDWGAAYDRYVQWRHIDTKEPIKGRTPIQMRILERAPVFRCDWSTGSPLRIPGKYIELKSRRIHSTSLWMGMGGLGVAFIPKFRFTTIMPVENEDMEGWFDDWVDMYKAMVEQHNVPPLVSVRRTAKRAVNAIGSVMKMRPAGVGKNVSDRQRGSGIDFLLMSESHVYQNPELTWAAFSKMVPQQSGWIVAEATPPELRSQWHASEWDETNNGRGSFDACGFVPWHEDDKNRIRRGTPMFNARMCPEFEATMDAEDISREDILGLDVEQRAWRRQNYLCGTVMTIRQNRRENPETPDMCYESQKIDHYIAVEALQMLRSGVRDPIKFKPLASGWSAKFWRDTPKHLLITTDSARKDGRDYCVVLALEWETLDLVALVHGRASARQHYQAILYILQELGCEEKHRHTISPERNRDVGLIDSFLVHDRRLNCYRRQARDQRTGRWRTSKEIGHYVSSTTRPKIISAMTYMLQGDFVTDEEEFGPQCDLPSEALVTEAEHLTVIDSKVQAAEGCHDDIIIAFGAACWLRRSMKPPSLGTPQASKQQTKSVTRRASRLRPR